MKFSITNFFSKCDQIPIKLRIWLHLLKKSVMENFIFCAVDFPQKNSSDNFVKFTEKHAQRSALLTKNLRHKCFPLITTRFSGHLFKNISEQLPLNLVSLTKIETFIAQKVVETWLSSGIWQLFSGTYHFLQFFLQKQSSEVFYKKRCSKKIGKIHRKTPLPETLF